MFARCFLSTLESTARRSADGGTYVITGDIEAMWLRDSTEQVLHYLRFAAEDAELASWIERLIRQQIDFVLIDPYANAFNMEPNGRHGFEDVPKAGPWIWERKYELDSLCHVLLLALRYHQATGRTAFLDDSFFAGVEKILDVITRGAGSRTMQPVPLRALRLPALRYADPRGKGRARKAHRHVVVGLPSQR